MFLLRICARYPYEILQQLMLLLILLAIFLVVLLIHLHTFHHIVWFELFVYLSYLCYAYADHL